MTIFDLIHELDPNLEEAKKLRMAKKFVDDRLMDLKGDEAIECILEISNHLKLSRDYKTNLKDHYKSKNNGKPEKEVYEYPEEIKKLAYKILKDGDPLKFMLDTFNMRHVGDRNVAENCLCSVGSTYILNTRGLPVKSSGDSGKGKSNAMVSGLELLPADKFINASMSSKALFYHKNLKAGTIIYSDDADFNNDTIATIKQATSSFQKPTTHITVSNHEFEEHIIPERCSFWFSNVEGIGDEQLANRFLNVDIDSSREQDVRVHEHFKEAELDLNMPVDDDVLICRCMFDMLGEELYKIKIPYMKAIEWYNIENRRNFQKFVDIIRSVTFFNIKQREKINDYYLADIEDYDVALRIYKGTSKNNATNLTDTEIKLLKFIAKTPRTIKDLMKETEKSRVRIMQILNGKDGKGGMLAKVPGLNKVDRTKTIASEYDDLTNEVTDEVTLRENIYTFTGSVDFDIYDKVARLDRNKAIEAKAEYIQKFSVSNVTTLLPDCNQGEFTLKTSTVDRINNNCNINKENVLDDNN